MQQSRALWASVLVLVLSSSELGASGDARIPRRLCHKPLAGSLEPF